MIARLLADSISVGFYAGGRWEETDRLNHGQPFSDAADIRRIEADNLCEWWGYHVVSAWRPSLDGTAREDAEVC
jgi:hypothetical protein